MQDNLRMKGVFEKFHKNMNYKKFLNFTDYETYFSSVDYSQKRNRAMGKPDKVELDCYGFKVVSS